MGEPTLRWHGAIQNVLTVIVERDRGYSWEVMVCAKSADWHQCRLIVNEDWLRILTTTGKTNRLEPGEIYEGYPKEFWDEVYSRLRDVRTDVHNAGLETWLLNNASGRKDDDAS